MTIFTLILFDDDMNILSLETFSEFPTCAGDTSHPYALYQANIDGGDSRFHSGTVYPSPKAN